MQVTIHEGINIIYCSMKSRPVGHMIRRDSKVGAISDGCGNLTANHPAIRAQIAEDSRKFREITDLRARGIIS